MSARRLLLLISMTVLTSACKVAPCDQFAPPFDQRPDICPTKYTASQLVPPPANLPNPNAARYCYKALAEEDCYTQPQPGRTGYLGAYAPNVIPSSPTVVVPPNPAGAVVVP